MREQHTDFIMEPDELLEKLTAIAVELYAGGEMPDSEEIARFNRAIPLLASVWNTTDGTAEKALETIATQRQMVVDYDAGDHSGDCPLALGEEAVFHRPDGHKCLSMLTMLTDTMIWLDDMEERLVMAQLTAYLKDYWCIEDYLQR